jgi:hypothetical protein
VPESVPTVSLLGAASGGEGLSVYQYVHCEHPCDRRAPFCENVGRIVHTQIDARNPDQQDESQACERRAGFGRGSLSSEGLRKGFGYHDENQEQASR